MAIILLLFAAVAGIALLSILRGFVLSYLWSWFVVPFGVFELSIPHAIGISMLVAFLTYENTGGGKDDDGMAKFIGSVLAMPFVLLIGYLVHSFM